jgi:hypothetical protein
VKLETIAPLWAWIAQCHSAECLPAGTLITDWRIVRGDAGAEEAYLIYFKADRLEYACPLHQFLPRTQSVQLVAESAQLKNAVAV